MHSVELERDIQDVSEMSLRLKRGTDVDEQPLVQRLRFMTGKVSAWQWCIHGDTLEFRKDVVSWLVGKGQYTQAMRFALCGKGDMLLKHDKSGAARVKPKGCGMRFCPRCSRRSGRKHLSRVAGHLSTSAHGSLWHAVLTQKALPEESIASARSRFEKSWKRFYPTLRKAGLVSALATYHVKASLKYGWHYHCHLVVEFDDVVDHDSLYDRLNLAWRTVTSLHESHLNYTDLFMRKITDGGPALKGMAENTQLDFWSEPQDEVEKVLHYVLRDVLQGIETWVGVMQDRGVCVEFCETMGTAKRHRCYGKWRKAAVGNEGEARDASEETELAENSGVMNTGVSEWSEISTMDRCLTTLKGGDGVSKSLLMQLIGCTNRSAGVLFRLRQVVQSIAA